MISALKTVDLADCRSNDRFLLQETCTVKRWRCSFLATTINLSRRGICVDIQGMGSISFDAELEVFLRDYKPMTAMSRWSNKRTFGLMFTSPIEDNPEMLALLEELERGQ